MNGMKRWLYAALSVVTLIFLGLIYAWSVFVVPLETEFGWMRAETSLTFSISMAFFCIGGLFSGLLSQKVKPKLLLITGGGLILLGFGLLTRAESLLALYCFYGVFAGFGVGIGYNSLMSLVMKWFPDKAGLLSGLLLMGFGFGGSILGSVFTAGIQAMGWRSTFLVSGVVMFIIMLLTAVLLKEAPQGAGRTQSEDDFTPKQMLKDRRFRYFYLWAILLSAGGLALIGCAAPLASDFIADTAMAATAAGLVSIANGGGRLVFGFVLDRFGIPRSLKAISLGFLLGGIALTAAVYAHSTAVLAIAFLVTGFFYGAVTPTNSAFIIRTFGGTHYSMNFSLVCTNLLFAAFLGPSVSGVLQNGGAYHTTALFVILLGVLSVPALLLMYRKKTKT